MTWAEFQIRSFAYSRIQDREDIRAREIAWASLISFNVNPKKIPKSKQRFWQIGKEGSEITDIMRSAIQKAKEKYLKDKKDG